MQWSHALCNIVEINELVILVVTLALVTHIELNNPILDQKIQTVEQHLNLMGTLATQNH